jgi:hypothetical protein
MSALNEQRPKIWIAFLGDVQLRLTASRVAACRLETDIAARVATLRETVRIFESQDIGQRHQRTHAINLGQERHFGIRCLPEFDDLSFVPTNLQREYLDACQYRFHRVRRAGLRSVLNVDLMIRLLDPCSRSPFVFTSPRAVLIRVALDRTSAARRRISDRSACACALR